jgi:hypothetical protein
MITLEEQLLEDNARRITRLRAKWLRLREKAESNEGEIQQLENQAAPLMIAAARKINQPMVERSTHG